MSVFNTWLINKVSGLIIAGSMILIIFEEIPSSPQLFFVFHNIIIFHNIMMLKLSFTQMRNRARFATSGST